MGDLLNFPGEETETILALTLLADGNFAIRSELTSSEIAAGLAKIATQVLESASWVTT